MAKTQTFTQVCSQVGSFSYAQYFTLYVVLTDRDGSTSTNKSKVDYNVYCQSSGAGSISANHDLIFSLNGNVIRNENVYVNVSSPNALIQIAKGTLEVGHNSDGKKSIDFNASIKATGGFGVSASTSGTFALETISRYPKFTTKPSITGRGLNWIKFKYGALNMSSDIYYSLDNSSWIHVTSDETKISNLDPEKTYTIYVQARNQADNSLRTTETISATTYEIAKINSILDFNHGDNVDVEITNPAEITELNLVMKIQDSEILNRTVTEGNNTIIFSDTELDNLYKEYGSSSNLTATFALSGSGYTNTKTCTVTLKGNQKTAKTNVNSSWKRGKIFTNVNGIWKKAVIWTNVNGTWKRSI